MIFHEKLKLKFDVDAMCDEIDSVQKRLGGPILQESNQEFGGWSLQSDNGDWRRGFEEGAIYEHPLEGGYLGEVAKPPTNITNEPKRALVYFLTSSMN